MDAINNVQYHNNINSTPSKTRRETTQEVATGVGAAGITAQATTYASKKGVYGKFKSIIGLTGSTAKKIKQNSTEATGLWNKFFKDIKVFSADALARIMKFKDMKYIGPIVKSPITKGATTLFGATMAFFVLVSGIQKAVDNGKIAVCDIKNKFDKAA